MCDFGLRFEGGRRNEDATCCPFGVALIIAGSIQEERQAVRVRRMVYRRVNEEQSY